MLFLSCSDCCTERRGAGRWAGASSPSHPTGPQAPFLGNRHGPQKLTPLPKRVTAGQAVLGKERRSPPGEHPGSVECLAWAPSEGQRGEVLRREGGPRAGLQGSSRALTVLVRCGAAAACIAFGLQKARCPPARGGFGGRGSVRWPQGASLAPK